MLEKAVPLLFVALMVGACGDIGPGEPSDLAFRASFCEAQELRQLLEGGADPNDRSSGVSAFWSVLLHMEPDPACFESLQVLVEFGGRVDRDERGYSAIGAALSGGAPAGVVEYLGGLGETPCGPFEDHVNFDFFEGDEPESLIDFARRESSVDAIEELERLLAECASR